MSLSGRTFKILHSRTTDLEPATSFCCGTADHLPCPFELVLFWNFSGFSLGTVNLARHVENVVRL